jgi:hypothetical protein
VQLRRPQIRAIAILLPFLLVLCDVTLFSSCVRCSAELCILLDQKSIFLSGSCY